MTISAISSSSLYSYSPSTQYSYFGGSISDERLQELLEEYGIDQTGDSETDLKALYDAMYSQASLDAQQASAASLNFAQPSKPDASSLPWADVMVQVGLTPTGNVDDDYDSFNNKIWQMQISYSAANSAEGLAFINQLNSEAEIAFNQSAAASVNAPMQSTTQASGSDIMAQMNK